MKTAKEIIESKTRRSKEKFEFDESIVDSLSKELRAVIGNAMPCNVSYTAYYVCKYRDYNNEVLASIMSLLDLSCYPEYWIERMIVKISEYADNGGDDINEYIRFLALYPQETAEDNLEYCLDFAFDNQYDTDQCMKELNMSKWELYYQHKAVKITYGLTILRMFYGRYPHNKKKFLFLKALWEKINPKVELLIPIYNKDQKEVAEIFVEEAIVGNKERLDSNMVDWYTNLLKPDSDSYRKMLQYFENAGNESTLDIYFEEV